MSHSREAKKRVSHFAGATIAGGAELILFYPPDTIARRLQANEQKIFIPGDLKATFQNFTNVTLKPKKFYSGFYAGFYDKLGKRGFKYGGQSFLMDEIFVPHFSSYFKQLFGEEFLLLPARHND